ncbi:putative transposase [Brucella pseudogrignonensis]|uniref:Transposase n=1 Tax=Brucella pseudogrignonensis TaxID=419475 RepID=A0ABU1MB49_9HYPH|nr:putative transposase [Brucella pseudogrignonensis]
MALRGVSIALACRTFGVSETCYRYSAKLNEENEQIADLLIGLTRAKKNWGFGLWALVFVFFTCAMSGGIGGTTSAYTASTVSWNGT